MPCRTTLEVGPGGTSLGMMWMSPVNGCSFADAGARTGKMPARRARPAAGPSGPDGGAQRAHTAVHARCVARIIKLAPRHAALLDDLPATRCRGPRIGACPGPGGG